MATAQIYNGFGQYEQRGSEKGMTLSYAGVPFWLPFEKVTYFPNYNFRELDQDKSTGRQGEKVPQVYQDVRVSGERLVEEMTMPQIPRPNSDKGIIKIVGTPTGKMLRVPAGADSETAELLYADVPEVIPTSEEVAKAARLAKAYKEAVIAEYFQSKRQRMSGGQGQLQPSEQVRLYMEELGVADIDDVQNHAAIKGGLDPEVMAQAIAMAMQIINAKKQSQFDAELEKATRP